MSEPFDDRPDLGVPRWRALSETVGALLVGGSVLLITGGILGAIFSSGNLDSTARLELVSRAANPTVATMILVGVAFAVLPGVAAAGPSSSVAAPSASTGALAALIVALLAVSAALLDITTGERTGSVRLSLVIFRLGSLLPAAGAVWLGAMVPAGARRLSAPARPQSPPPAAD